MIIYRDIITNDELFSDSYKLKLLDDIIWEVEGKLISEKMGIDDSLIGANASADAGDADEGVADGAKSGVDIILANRLQPTSFDKKSYTVYIKEYMKKVKARLEKDNPDRVEVFASKAQAQVKKILGNFKNYDFYTGESMNPEGMVALLDYREDGTTPFMLFFKDGLLEEKC